MRMLTNAEQNKAQRRLRYWEHTYRRDSLTGLLNHAAFRSDVELKLLEGKSKIMMLMMDVDRFKAYNDTFGHHEGDKFLILVAQTLLAALKKEDRACRMGGDEFAAILFFDKVNITLKTVEGGAGVSMGMVITESEMTFNQLYEAADKALYQAKEHGRGRLAAF